MFEKLPPKVLVIDNDEVILGKICNGIERALFSVVRAYEIPSGIEMLKQHKLNAVVITTRFGKEQLHSIMNEFVEKNLCIVIAMEENENIESYKDFTFPLLSFIKRPFTPNELITQIKSLLRKANPVFEDKILRYKDLYMDLATYKVNRGSKQIYLGPTEFKMLQTLIMDPKHIFSREQILELVWGKSENIDLRTIDVHINRIRSFLKLDTDITSIIQTVRSKGYCLSLPGQKD
jgi:two-component system phosphate regulon response regulator PhoB